MIELCIKKMEQVVITVELHESIMKCRQELMFVVADPKEKWNSNSQEGVRYR